MADQQIRTAIRVLNPGQIQAPNAMAQLAATGGAQFAGSQN
jgi:hypothetical protein